MDKASAVVTPFGTFNNRRNNIVAHKIKWSGSKLTFYLNISKSGIIRTQKTVYNDVDFKVKFHGILSLFQAKYDTYEEMDKIYVKPKSSVSAFEIIHNSNYIKKLPATKAVKRNMKHYRLSTIDDVFNILAEGHEFKVRQ